jgi:branched-chain amino acid transport system permease protein
MASAAHLVLVAAAAVAGYFVPVLLGGSPAIYSACVLIAIFATMAYGLDTIVSDVGEVSLGQSVFFAAGAYTTALLSTGPRLGPVSALLGSIVVALVIAAALGLVTLGLREFVFSVVTYAVAVVAASIAANWWFLGGSDGLRGIPAFQLSFGPLSLTANNDRELWPVAYLLLLLALYLVFAFRRSRLGQSALMMHLNVRLATMSGVDPQRTRLQVFLFSAPITAAAGWLYAYERAYVSADVLETYFLILMLTAVVLVGRRLLLGPLVGIAVILLQEKFFSLGGDADKIILGSALILTLALLPRGLAGPIAMLIDRLARGSATIRKGAKR